jgi:prevent-host-death family protein
MTLVINLERPAALCPMERQISASQFKARCLALMDDVASSGEPLVITKNGKPVVELHPHNRQSGRSPFGLHPGTRLLGDVISPLDEPWDALA